MSDSNAIIARQGNRAKHPNSWLATAIKQMGIELGFAAVAFTSPNTQQYKSQYKQWLSQDYHGTMQWMERNIDKRFDGGLLHPDTRTAISVRLDYKLADTHDQTILSNPTKAYVSRYALGRDYHKVLRKRLTEFGKAIENLAGEHGYRAFVDSAPVMERQLAQQAGLGWIGKNSLLLAPGAGSWFFLGELFTNLDLPFDAPQATSHCGSCRQCMIDCPTDAFVAEGILDARKCISYLTIEYAGSIPVELRKKMGNRIYGCDDCQLVCPHNSKAPETKEADFNPRHQLQNIDLLTCYQWDEPTFLDKTEGNPIRRIGYEQWLRNITIALGNAPYDANIVRALQEKKGISDLLDEHIDWALAQHSAI